MYIYTLNFTKKCDSWSILEVEIARPRKYFNLEQLHKVYIVLII